MLKMQELSDHIEISQVIQRYGKALDDKNYGLLQKVFTEDAQLVFWLSGRLIELSMQQSDKLWREHLTKCSRSLHLFSNPVIEIQGDRAHTSCRSTATHIQIREDGSRNIWIVQGFVEDEWIRKPEGWRIWKRVSNNPYDEGAFLAEGVREFPEAPSGWDAA